MAGRKSKDYLWWIAWRYLTSKKKRSGLSFMTTISVGGVAVGVFALIVVLSAMGGFEQDLKSKMFRGLPHLEVYAKNTAAGFSLKEFPLSNFRKDFKDAVHIEPFVRADVVLKQGRNLASVTIFGIDPEKGGKLWGFYNSEIMGDLQSIAKKHKPLFQIAKDGRKLPGIVLGEGIADFLSAEMGDEILVLNPQSGAADALTGSSVSSRFVVSGIFRTDLAKFDTKYAVVSINNARQFMADYDPVLDEEQYVSGVAVNVKEPENIDSYVSKILKYKSLDAITWKTVNKSLLFALKLEKFTMGAILLLIVLVAAFSISGTIMMTVFHKRSQVALLRSLGMAESEVSKLFLIHGITIGGVGVATGAVLGIGFVAVQHYFGVINMPSGVYQQQVLPMALLPLDYIVIAVVAIFLSWFAAVYPARIAAKQQPGSGLRYR